MKKNKNNNMSIEQMTEEQIAAELASAELTKEEKQELRRVKAHLAAEAKREEIRHKKATSREESRHKKHENKELSRHQKAEKREDARHKAAIGAEVSKVGTKKIVKPLAAVASLIGGVVFAFQAVKFIVKLDKKEEEGRK